MKPIRRRHLMLLALLPALLGAAGCGDSDEGATAASPGTPTDTVKVAYISPLPKPYGIEAWGAQRGLFAEPLARAGIGKVEFVRFTTGPDAGAAQASGAIDVAIVGDVAGVSTKVSGIDTKLVSVPGINLDAWLLTRADGPGTVQELAGKKVATVKGSYMDKYLTALLEKEHLTGKVKLVNLVPANAIAALVSKNIDAYAGPPFYPTEALDKAGLRIIDRALDHQGLGGITTTTVRSEFAEQHPGFAKAWNEAVVAARADALGNADAFYEAQADANEIGVDQATRIFDIAKTVPEDQLAAQNVEDIQATAQFLVDNGLQRQLADVSSWILDPRAHGTGAGS